MPTVIEATYDGAVFRPTEPVQLEPNTPVRLTVETLPFKTVKPRSFLETAEALKLEGPPDWSANLDNYLCGEEEPGAG